MAKIIRKQVNKNSSKIKNGSFSRIKFSESYISLIIGAIVVLVIGIIILSYAKINRSMQTSSARDSQAVAQNNIQNSKTSSTYTVKPGEDLWTISENIYNNGYKWVEIAKINKLENPGLIHAGNKLAIPAKATGNSITDKSDKLPAGNKIINNSIAGNTYVVKNGDNLWNIAVRAYGDGYKWVEIAKANKLVNPELIHSGNFLKIPR